MSSLEDEDDELSTATPLRGGAPRFDGADAPPRWPWFALGVFLAGLAALILVPTAHRRPDAVGGRRDVRRGAGAAAASRAPPDLYYFIYRKTLLIS